MKADKAKMSKKQLAVAVAIALTVVIPWMMFGGDLGTGNALSGDEFMDQVRSCWWNVFCLGFCDC